jgi:hypothetical protein
MTTQHNGTKFISKDKVSEVAHSAGDAARRNWIPLGLIGAGLAWATTRAILDARTRTQNTLDDQGEDETVSPPERDVAPIEAVEEQAEDLQQPHELVSRGERITGQLRGQFRTQMDRADRIAHQALDKGQKEGQEILEQVRQTRERVTTGLSHDLKRHPLLYVGLGLVAGTALGVALPTSRAERRMIGRRVKAAQDNAQQKIQAGLERIHQSASPTSREDGDDIIGTRQDNADLH